MAPKSAGFWPKFGICALLVVWEPNEATPSLSLIYLDISHDRPTSEPTDFYLKNSIEIGCFGFFSDVVSKRTKVAHQVLKDAKHRTREFHDCVRALVTEKMVFFMKKFYQPAREILRKKSVTKSSKIWAENEEFRSSEVKKQQLEPVRFLIFSHEWKSVMWLILTCLFDLNKNFQKYLKR